MGGRENILKAQYELMRSGIGLVSSRAKIIEERPETYLDPAKESRAIGLNIFAAKSLRLYASTLMYLTEEVLDDDESKFAFLLPNVRTLMEIHARFLDLEINCHSDDDRALRCMHYHLFKVASMPFPEPTRTDNYLKVLEVYKPFLQAANINLPLTVTDFTFKKWVERPGYSFTRMEDVLVPQNMKKYCLETQRVFGAEKLYEMYSYFSELVHGNPYVSSSSPHNERFWVISLSITTTAFLVELVDRCRLGTPNKPDFREWLKELEKSKREFVSLWHENKLAGT